MVAAGGEHLVAGAESFTRTPVVFGVPETMATALGYPAKPIGMPDIEKLCADPDGWGSVGKPLWGCVQDLEDEPQHVDHRPLGDPHAVVRGRQEGQDLTVADVQRPPTSRASSRSA